MELHRVWVPNDGTVFTLAVVLEENEELHQITVELESDGSIRKVNKSTTHDVDRTHMLDLDDLCDMNNLHEAPLLDVIRRRLIADKIYTYTGNFLVSLNPYKYIPELYDNPMAFLDMEPLAKVDDGMVIYAPRPLPHVYAIANNALRALETADNKPGVGSEITLSANSSYNQSIIITGESGAGKTEASKHVMTFLTVANNSQGHKHNQGNHGEKIKSIILDSSVIFESFGNAKTVRNDNSSRFGKYIKLMYSGENQLLSAHTETFLLEKSRLVSVGKGERNYHIFYQLIRGLKHGNLTLAQSLKLENVEFFCMLTEGACTVIHTEEEDRAEFESLCQALTTLGWTHEEMERLWQLLAAILHLGNFTVNATGGDADPCLLIDKVGGMNMDEIAGILGVDSTNLTKGITEQRMQAGKRASLHVKMLSPSDCKNNIMALMKWLYKTIFAWIVRKVNYAHSGLMAEAGNESQSVSETKVPSKFIGILDIFGFEILGTNSFEQLCINYTNERLQQQFNEHVFVLEQQEYAREGLDWKSISYRDNQHVIDLIAKRPSGLLMILEEHGMMNRKPDDLALVNAFNQMHDKTQTAYLKSRFGNDRFVVKHFAGDVTYTVEGFLAKNNDSLQEGLTEAVHQATSVFLGNLLVTEDGTGGLNLRPGPGYIPLLPTLPSAATAAAAATSTSAVTETDNSSKRASASSKKMASSITVSFYFRNQLDTLMNTLRCTQPHYIKCIKPNALKAPDTFAASLVMEQLRYSGVLEVVRIRREGFPSKIPFKDFYEQYELLAFGKGWTIPADCTVEQAKEYCIQLAHDSLSPHSYQIGSNYVFLGHNAPDELLAAIANFYRSKAVIVQSRFRRNVAVALYQQTRKQLLVVSSMIRMFLARKYFRRVHRQVSGIQKCYRLLLFKRLLADSNRRRVLKKRNDSAACIQAQVRRIRAKKLAAALRITFTKIQLFLSKKQRKNVDRRKYITIRQKIVSLQSRFRTFLCCCRFRKISLNIVRVQTFMRTALCRRHYLTTRNNIVAVQSWSRATCQRKLFSKQKSMAIRIQSAIRGFICQCWYQKSLWQLLLLQTWIRSRLSRKYFLKMKKVVVVLQTWRRKSTRRKQFLKHKQAAIVVQTSWRRHFNSRRYNRMKVKVVVIQKLIRMWMQQLQFKKIMRAIRLFQRMARFHIRKLEYQAKEHAITVIQSNIRAFIARSSYRRMVSKIVLLQTVTRGFLLKSKFVQARQRIIIMQSQIRMFLKYFRYKFMRLSAIEIQRVYRTHSAVSHYQSQRLGIIRIQTCCRMRLQKLKYETIQFSVLTIQSHFRKYTAASRYFYMKMSATMIQTYIRRYLAVNAYKKHIRAASVICGFCRMYNEVRHYEVVQFSVLLIQNQIRRHLAESHYFLIKFSCLLLQTKIREFVARRKYETAYAATIKLQSFGRMIIARNAYDLALFSIVSIQTVARKFICSTNYRQQLARIVKVQSFYRMAAAKNSFNLKKFAATKIQSVARMQPEYLFYLLQQQCAIILHKRARGIIARLHFLKQRQATIRIQSHIRKWSCLYSYRLMWHSALKIQMLFRRRRAKTEVAELRYATWRLGKCIHAFIRNLRLFKQLSILHRYCVTGDLSQVRGHLARYPNDQQLRYKWSACGNLFSSAIFGGQVGVLAGLGCKTGDLLKCNRAGDGLLLALAQSPDYNTLQYLVNIVNSINTKVEYEVKEEDDADDDDTGKMDDVIASSPSSVNRLTDAISGLPILMTGWMKKKRNSSMMGFKKWNRRWCVLTEETLTYYKTDARNSKPCGFLPLEGCIIERPPGREAIITVVSPQTVFKKGMFGDKMVGPLVLQVDTEMELQEWLNPLKAAAGVTPFRTTDIAFADGELRESWLKKVNLCGDNALHCLARASEMWIEAPLQEIVIAPNNTRAATIPAVASSKSLKNVNFAAAATARRQCRSRFNAMSRLLGTKWNAAAKNKMQCDSLKMMSWLLCAGCPLEQTNSHGLRPLQLALESRNFPLVIQLVRRGAQTAYLSPTEKGILDSAYKAVRKINAEPDELVTNGVVQLALPAPLKLKGYSFVQFWVRNQFLDANSSKPDSQIENPLLSISLYNRKLELVEASQDFVCPLSVAAGNFWWGQVWHMQTPVENIEDKCFVVIKNVNVVATERFHRKEVSWTTFTLTKASIDSKDLVFTLLAGVADLDAAAKGEEGLVTPLTAPLTGQITNKLEVGLVLTKKFRQADLESYI